MDFIHQNTAEAHYVGIDPTNEVDLWIEYLYKVAPQKATYMVGMHGYDNHSVHDVLLGMKAIASTEQGIYHLIQTLDPNYSLYGEVYVKHNGFTQKKKGLEDGLPELPIKSNEVASDLAAQLKKVFTVELNFLHVIILVVLAWLFVKVFEKQNS